MGASSKIQTSFGSGELSPFLYSRVDLARYLTGLKTCRNFFIHPHGGASNRPGFKYGATTKYSALSGRAQKASRAVKFIFSSTQAYVIEFGEYYVRFIKNHSPIAVSSATAWGTGNGYVVGDFVTESATIYYCQTAHTAGTFANDLASGNWVAQTVYEVPTPYAATDLAKLRFERSADVLYMFHPDFQTRTLSRYDDTDWRVELYNPTDGPFMPENITTATLSISAVSGSPVNLISSVSKFTADHVGALFKLTHYIPGRAVSTAVTTTAATASVSCFTTWRIITHGTWTATFDIQKSIDGGSTWTTLRTFSGAADINVNTYGTEDIETNSVPFLIRIKASSFTSGTMNVDLTADPFYQSGVVRVLTVANGTAATAEVLTAAGSTAATTTWAEGAWSDENGLFIRIDFV
jgi:hypothetical protein